MTSSVAPTTDSHISSETIDDLMRYVVERILSAGDRICPTRGSARELSGMLLEIRNPRCRISRTETRGKPFSCLGELCWYLSASNELSFICYYIPAYREYSDGSGGYGPRLFNWRGINQFDNVASILRSKPDSRQAVIQLFDGSDTMGESRDVPCTCTLQFMLRDNRLNLIVYMRSNDAYLGLPHDVFCFTMLQEIMARRLGVNLGTYRHMVGSLHLYKRNIPEAKEFLSEGWQPTTMCMPSMPAGDPRPHIGELLEAENSIRTTGSFDLGRLNNMNPYWADLVRVLLVFRYGHERRVEEMRELQNSMSSDVYDPYIDRMIRRKK